MKTYLCQENSSGDLYLVTADSKDDGVYRVFGSEIYKTGWDIKKALTFPIRNHKANVEK